MAKKTIESSMKKIESIIDELENGDLPLEQALKKFEEGIALSKTCSKQLDETEKKITLLLSDDNGKTVETDFDSVNDSNQ